MNNIVNPNSIQQYIKEKNITEKEFCKACNISQTSLEKILKLDDRVKLLDFLKVRFFLRREGYVIS